MFECGMFNCVLCSGLAVEQRKLVIVYFVGATQNDNHHYPPLNNDENKQQHSNILSELNLPPLYVQDTLKNQVNQP